MIIITRKEGKKVQLWGDSNVKVKIIGYALISLESFRLILNATQEGSEEFF